MPNKYMKNMLNLTNQWRNANQIHNEILSFLSQNDFYQKNKKITNTNKVAEKG